MITCDRCSKTIEKSQNCGNQFFPDLCADCASKWNQGLQKLETEIAKSRAGMLDSLQQQFGSRQLITSPVDRVTMDQVAPLVVESNRKGKR